VRMTGDAILNGRPVTHVVMSIAGDAVERPGTYRVAIGTTMAELARRVGLLGAPRQVIWGGPLSGIPLEREGTVVTIDTNAVLMFLDAPASSPVPCIRCGWCVEDCPVGLDPTALIHLEAEVTCRSEDLNLLRACVDCGLCSHVCPSQLPLAQSIWRARQRFEGGPSS
jgi:Na+-translocating ferredoxin:NAD+ oxidoreductase subunit C